MVKPILYDSPPSQLKLHQQTKTQNLRIIKQKHHRHQHCVRLVFFPVFCHGTQSLQTWPHGHSSLTLCNAIGSMVLVGCFYCCFALFVFPLMSGICIRMLSSEQTFSTYEVRVCCLKTTPTNNNAFSKKGKNTCHPIQIFWYDSYIRNMTPKKQLSGDCTESKRPFSIKPNPPSIPAHIKGKPWFYL